MLKYILPLIPQHTTYCEPFFGGGAVFFGKEPSKVEVINDLNTAVGIFYEQLKNNLNALESKIKGTLYSRKAHSYALTIYKNISQHEPLDIA